MLYNCGAKSSIFFKKTPCISSLDIPSALVILFFFAHAHWRPPLDGTLSLSLAHLCNSTTVTWDGNLIFTSSPSAPARGDHIERRGSAPDPPGAAVQEEGQPSEGGQPGFGAGQTRRASKEQEARQNSEEGERQTRPQAKGE